MSYCEKKKRNTEILLYCRIVENSNPFVDEVIDQIDSYICSLRKW